MGGPGGWAGAPGPHAFPSPLPDSESCSQHSCALASPDLVHVSQCILPLQLLGAEGRRGRPGSPGSGHTVEFAPPAVFL